MGSSKDFTSNCRRCRLCKSRTQVVYGRGSNKADIVFVGEAPGKNEDDEGKPFVGRAGSILNQIIKGIGLRRKDVFITNACLCRPPNNRKPFPSEIKACRPRLIKSLRHKGKVVILLGRSASEAVLRGVNTVWGKPYYSKRLRKYCIPTKHPSWYLRGNLKYLHFGIIEISSAIEEVKQLVSWKHEEKRNRICKIS